MMAPHLTDIRLHKASRQLEICFEDQKTFHLSFEFLRVFSPSAEPRGHGPGPVILPRDKQEVGILEIRPVGHYGISPTFTDGHQSGIYTFEYLYELGLHQDRLWAEYQAQNPEQGAPSTRPPCQTPPGDCS